MGRAKRMMEEMSANKYSDEEICKKCNCTFKYTIIEGNNPGCKDKEIISCPKCGEFVMSKRVNDGTVYCEIIK